MSLINPAELDQLITDALTQEVSAAISLMVASPEWVSALRQLLISEMTRKVLERVNLIDVNGTIAAEVRRYIKEIHEKNLPDQGIVDKATTNQLEVSDQGVTVTALTANNVSATLATVGTLVITDDAEIHGKLSFDSSALEEAIKTSVSEQIVKDLSTIAASAGLSKLSTAKLNVTQIEVDGTPLVTDRKLTRYITDSELTSVGTLESLAVSGSGRINGTLYVNAGRIGVNTPSPDAALSVWDEDVAISIGKHSPGLAFIGTSRSHTLALGVNRTPVVTITEAGMSVPALAVKGHALMYSPSAPSAAGNKGDIAFNSAPSENGPFAWVCLGGTRWVAKK